MLINDDFRLHRQITTQQNVKEIRIRPNIIYDITILVLLLEKLDIKVLNQFFRPFRKKRQFFYVIKPPNLFEVFDMEDLLVEV